MTKVTIDPDQGGCTTVEGGHPVCILAAGYIGSTIFGGLFIMAGFDTLVSKIVSFIIGLGLIAPLAVVRNKLCVSLTCSVLLCFLPSVSLSVHRLRDYRDPNVCASILERFCSL